MNTPDTPEAIEEGLSRFMRDLPHFLSGKSPQQKQMILAGFLGEAVFSVEHTAFGYWTVSTPLGSGIFSLERDTFLEIPEGKGAKKYFSNITSKGVISLSDGTEVLTISFGGHRITTKEIIRIERFCFIQNGQIYSFDDLPNPCSLQMASTIFQTKGNEAIARTRQDRDESPDGGE